MENENQNTSSSMPNQNIILLGSKKSMVLSLVLSFFFGPFGLLYSTVKGGVIMIILTLLISFVTLGFFVLVSWPICMIWGAISVSNHNNRINQTINNLKK